MPGRPSRWARWPAEGPGSNPPAIALQDQEWTARGPRSHLVVREPAVWTATGLRGARRPSAWTVVSLADGSSAAVRVPLPRRCGNRD